MRPTQSCKKISIEIEFTPQRRGKLNFEGITLACPDRLGLYRSLNFVPDYQTCLILPRRYPIAPLKLGGNRKYQAGGISLANSVGDSSEFLSLREYRNGDPLNTVHWKSFARHGELVVKEYQDEYFARRALVLDTFASDLDNDYFEAAVSVAASVCMSERETDSLLDLMFVGEKAHCFTSGRGVDQMPHIQEILASVQTSSAGFEELENAAATGLDDLESLEIVQQFGNDLILALPDGIATIGELDNSTITRTELGAFKISEPPAWARYPVTYSGVRRSDVSRNDLGIPEQHKHWLSQVSENLALANKPPEQQTASIRNYFLKHFTYTLYTPSQSDVDQALTEFMLERRAGHCEYFAMATVLLLRYSGIPARLANGYSVQEYDPDSGMYVVRRRHSHAWAIAKLADSWNAVDTTPPQWLELEARNAGGLNP